MSKPCNAPAGGARARILAATRDLAAERGPRNISIEAVAVRAGLSKGGVLYHFRTKADLLAALVGSHVDATQHSLERHLSADSPNALARALVASRREERDAPAPPAAEILAVLAEHPDLLDPVGIHHQSTLDRLRRESTDAELAEIVFLALEGLRAMSLFGFDLFDRQAESALLDRMTRLLGNDGAGGDDTR